MQSTTRREEVHVKPGNTPVVPETKQPKIKTRRRDVFNGDITGFIDDASNGGDVIAYQETLYIGDPEEISKPPQAPGSKRRTRTQDQKHAKENDIEGESESSDDGGGGAVFNGNISGFVKKARGPGNAVAMKKVTYSRESTLNNSGGARMHPQEAGETMESRRGSNQEPVKIRASERTAERRALERAQNRPALPEPDIDMRALEKELETVSPGMQRLLVSLMRERSRSMEDEM